jgi:hypothetical protein
MTREQLEHAIRAACDVANDTELWVFGSQALLGQFPNAPDSLRASIEVDVQPKNKPDAIDLIDGSLGELSVFHSTHGFYVHGVSLDSARLPNGWETRVQAVTHPIATRGSTGWCVEIHDLAASKLVAFREKDREFVRTLIIEDMIDASLFRSRLDELDIDSEILDGLVTWLNATLDELGHA